MLRTRHTESAAPRQALPNVNYMTTLDTYLAWSFGGVVLGVFHSAVAKMILDGETDSIDDEPQHDPKRDANLFDKIFVVPPWN